MSKRHTRRQKHRNGAGGVCAPVVSKSPKIRILVAIPTLRHACTVEIAALTLKLGIMSAMDECPWEFDLKSSSGYSGLSYPVDYNRNLLAKHAIEKGYDWIWFVDSDVLPDDTFHHLLLLLDKGDAIAGIYPLFGKPPDPPVAWTAYEWKKGLNKDTGLMHEGFVLVDPNRENPYIIGGAAGTGNMLINRKVLIDPAMRVGPDDVDGTPAIFKLQHGITGKLIATEDMDFCKRMRENGHRLVIDLRVKWGHVKTGDVRGTENAMQWAFNQGRDLGRNESGNSQHTAAVRPVNGAGPVWNGTADAGFNQGPATSELESLRS